VPAFHCMCDINCLLIYSNLKTIQVPNFLKHVAKFIGNYIVAFVMLWRLAIVGFPFVVLIVTPGFIYKRIMIRLARNIREEYNQAGTIAEQVISSIRTVYSFARENKTTRISEVGIETRLD